MKKSLVITIHILAVLLIAAGAALLHGYSFENIGIAWTESASFSDSVLLSEMVSEDIENLKKFAVLKVAFEDDAGGEVDEDKTVVIANTSNGYISYTLSDLIPQAARYGYTFDTGTHNISAEEVSGAVTPYELKVTYKAYDPYYFNKIEIGPSQGVTNIRDLSIEVLRALSEYYRLNDIYGSWMSNFTYSLSFETDSGGELNIENSSRNTEEIRALGKYLIVGNDNSVETNIDPCPANILADTGYFTFGAEDGNLVEIGIDTAYIFEDRYRAADESFEADKAFVKRWVYIIAGALAAALISLVFVVRGFGEEDKKELRLDIIPLEALIFFMALASILAYALFKLTLNNIFEELLRYGDREFWRETAKAVIVWLFSVMILSSVYRRAINGGVFRHSLLNGTFLALTSEEAGRPAWNAFKGYAAFIAVNALAAVLAVYMWSSSPAGTLYRIAVWILIAALAAFDIYIYVLRVRNEKQIDTIRRVTGEIARGNAKVKLDESEFDNASLDIAENINNISAGLETAINEQVKADKLKADLITNVSHDIRTPLTSIINYVDLLKREDPEDPTIVGYIDVLEQKSARLKNLTDDLIEASKASSGNIKLDMQKIDMGELAAQAGGELKDKFTARGLSLELAIPEEPAYIFADGRYLYRVFENLYNNAAKYSMEGTRVYAEVRKEPGAESGTADTAGHYIFTIKNVSSERLNISPDELTERFVRGDTSRNTEGSGLGLSISKSLTDLMEGKLVIEIDGDLYKASVIMDKYED